MLKLNAFLLSGFVLLLVIGCTANVSQPTGALQNAGNATNSDDPITAVTEVTVDEVTGSDDNQTEESDNRANANVLFVQASQSGNGTWRFNVTVEHPDIGWDDYADGWDVVLPDGTVVKANDDDPFTRLLLHPHETEQPFTRSQSNLHIPESVTQVTVRAHDLVDGWGGQVVVVDFANDSGQGFEIQR